MRLYTAQEMRRADRLAGEAGIPSLLLMEAAGRKVAEWVASGSPPGHRVLVLCGKGNNGGDGYAAARQLQAMGRAPRVLELASDAQALASDDARHMRAAWLGYGGWAAALTLERLQAELGRADLVLDALFGSGLSRPLDDLTAALVETVNASGCAVWSVDVPSGIDADRPGPIGPHLRASHTLQLAGPKVASAFSPAMEAYGSWDVAEIGIPPGILERQSSCLLLDAAEVRPWLPRRPRDTHKYRVGTVLVVAGSARYGGAAELACRAALRAGAGLVTLAAEDRLANAWPEVIFERLDWGGQALEALARMPEKRRQVRVVGPGLDERALPDLPDLIRQSAVPTVLDAGALEPSEAWFAAVRQHGRCVITPHAGEASRLLGCAAKEIEADPLAAAQRLAEESGAVAVLKGASTVVAAPDGRCAVNTRSHPGLATGGTGDVLAGLLGAWLAGADDPFERAAATVFVHGLAGLRAAERYGDGLIASDVIEAFPQVWLELA